VAQFLARFLSLRLGEAPGGRLVTSATGGATHQFGVEVRLELNRAPGSVGKDEVGLDGSQRVQRFEQRDAVMGALDPDMPTTSRGGWVTWAS
jgi:hypothetical protein